MGVVHVSNYSGWHGLDVMGYASGLGSAASPEHNALGREACAVANATDLSTARRLIGYAMPVILEQDFEEVVIEVRAERTVRVVVREAAMPLPEWDE